MSLKSIVLKSEEEIKEHIKKKLPSFYYSSKTSTVIPYDKLEENLNLTTEEDYYLCDLSQLKAKMKLTEENTLIVSGNVSWKDAKDFLVERKRNIMTSPTEELALVNAGLATSCTGERCFSFGNLRSQVIRCKYLNHHGDIIELHRDRDLKLDFDIKAYQEEFRPYHDFKNAPFPRLEKEIDLMIGFEGQLGVIIESEIETVEDFDIQHLFILLPKWENDYKAHLEVCENIQAWRNEVIVCELIDENAFSYLKEDERPNKGMDAIFFEVRKEHYEKFYEEFILNLENIDQENVFELSQSKFHQLRASVPRAVFEKNSQMGVLKMGTDVQVRAQQFKDLLDVYQDFSKQGVKYNLFGHFGDAHLHFNFMPHPEQIDICQSKLEELYDRCVELKASPFAEHGIGLLKQKYMSRFYSESIYSTFKKLKEAFDPDNQFFPQGFLNKKNNIN